MDVPVEFKLNGSEVLRTDIKVVGDLKDNRFRGRAAGIGNMDRGGDVIAPGAFKDCRKEFIKSGEILIGHDWSGKSGVATIDKCEEVDDALEIECEFYSTEDAQTARQKLIERTQRKKTTGLSIGFSVHPDEVLYFETGEELASYCRKEGIKIDQASAKAWKRWCRLILSVKELFETSIVAVPMNPRAYTLDAKSFEGKALANPVSAILQAKIHQSFTVAADELAIRGYMDVEERIALSGAIGDSLRLFAESIDPEVGARVVAAEDVEWVASKSIFEGRVSLEERLDAVCDAAGQVIAELTRVKDMRAKQGRTLSVDRVKQADSLLSELNQLVSQLKEAPQDPRVEPSRKKQLELRLRMAEAAC